MDARGQNSAAARKAAFFLTAVFWGTTVVITSMLFVPIVAVALSFSGNVT
jgi:hypothetical protein